MDIRIKSRAESEDALREAFLLISRIWPHAVVEDADTGKVLSVLFPIEAFAGLTGIMVYRDAAARESWGRIGADPSNSNTMIHVIANEDSVTLVLDDPDDADMRKVVQGMETFLANDNFRNRSRGRGTGRGVKGRRRASAARTHPQSRLARHRE